MQGGRKRWLGAATSKSAIGIVDRDYGDRRGLIRNRCQQTRMHRRCMHEVAPSFSSCLAAAVFRRRHDRRKTSPFPLLPRCIQAVGLYVTGLAAIAAGMDQPASYGAGIFTALSSREDVRAISAVEQRAFFLPAGLVAAEPHVRLSRKVVRTVRCGGMLWQLVRA